MRLVLLCVLLLLPGVSAPGQAGVERVAGRVVSAKDGRALRRAAVTLRESRTQGADTATVFTDEEGRYRFAPVPAGKYSLTARAEGYLSASYLQHGQLSTAIVTGAGLEVGSLRLELTPTASITGRITDEAGEPLHRATVALYRENPEGSAQRVARVRTAQTQADGGYEFTGLAPGRFFFGVTATPWYAVHPPAEGNGQTGAYRVSVDAALDVAYPMMFYPASLTAEGASAIEIKGGEQMDANLQMVPQHALTLTLPRPDGDGVNRRFPQLARSVFGLEERVNMQLEYVDGAQRMTGLAPGEYVVEESSPGGEMRARRGTVDLTGGSTTLNVQAAALGSVTILVRPAEGAALSEKLQLTLRGAEGNERASVAVDAKGVATFDLVPQGEYRVSANAGGGRTLGVTSLTVAGKAAEGRRVRVAEGGRVSAEMVLAGAPVRVEGLAGHKGKADAAAMVVLVPAGAEAVEELFRRDQADLDGSFTFGNVVPGNYLVVAIDDGWPLRWTDAKVLVPYLLHGLPLTVGAKDGAVVKLAEVVEAQAR